MRKESPKEILKEKILAIDLGTNLWVCFRPTNSNDNMRSTSFKVSHKDIIQKLEDFTWESLKDLTIVTALPNVYGKMFYNVIINQVSLYWILKEKAKQVLIINEGAANKIAIGKGKVTKDETLNEIKRRGFKPTSYDEADAIKFILFTILHASTSEDRDRVIRDS